MTTAKHLAVTWMFIITGFISQAQTTIKGKIIDATTKEPVYGASVRCTDTDCHCGCITNSAGEFLINCKPDCKNVSVSFIGYTAQNLAIANIGKTIALVPSSSLMNEVVVSASRGETVKRSQAPVAISQINTKTIQETKATTVDQLLNKVSGVNMVNLGNEQHQMSIRQPMTTKSLFLYLEDGIPVRTTGLYNHNALLEMNMAAVKNIEVIKGPSSSLYGSEAIGGVVNFITIAPTSVPVLKLSAQRNNVGYKRADLQSSFSKSKWGFALSGYYADKRNSFMEYSDFHKATLTGRIDYRFSDKTTLSNSATWLNYYSDMPSGVDSTMFATRTFVNPQTFTYRSVNAFRYRSTLTHTWSDNSRTTVSLVYRDNTIGQNPAYRIKDDYKKVNGRWVGQKELAHGEINASSFNSYAFIAQHKQNLTWKNANIIGGVSVDLSPSTYNADYIRIKKDTVARKYVGYQKTDSTLTDYATKINNYAAFANFEFSPVNKLRVVASLRYDLFDYNFDNHLKPSAFSGSPDTTNQFKKLSSKIGFTYNVSNKTGFYANYSEGFVPPQVTEMYTGVKVPNISPSVFYNYEVGGWMEIVRNKLSVDASAYKLNGTNEIISVKLDDGSTENRNAGKTSHKGIEFGLNASPVTEITVRFSGAYSVHKFDAFVEKGNNYNGNEMNNAPHWIHNAEVWYKPSFVKGLRVGAEWQKVGSYYMDPKNTAKYKGYNVLTLRAGYQYNGFEIWLNVLNVTNNYYSYISTKSTSYSYTLAEPRSFNLGISYDLGQLLKK
ncbi:MAG TPA: TonB-dependent receptor [Flavisolibacter sp.]|nr:TonB-dependent receptor [Flavisolibacter sp.]